MNTTASLKDLNKEFAANPSMVMPKVVEAPKKVKDPLMVVPENPLKSTNIVDHLVNGSVICPADVSSNGLKKIFWRDLVEHFGCVYTSPLKPAAQIVLVTPKDNSVKFEQALKKGMNCVEYPVAVKDLRESTNEKVVAFLASNEEWQAMLQREVEVSQRAVKAEMEKVKRAERAAQKALAKAEAVKAAVTRTNMEVSVKDVEVPIEAGNGPSVVPEAAKEEGEQPTV